MTQYIPPGGIVFADGPIELNAGRPVTKLVVRNTGDRPIQVGSHFHFFEINAALEFDREQAFGKRLDIPATTAIRFEPGDEREVDLVPLAGKRRVYGFNNLVDGWTGGDETKNVYQPRKAEALRRMELLAEDPRHYVDAGDVVDADLRWQVHDGLSLQFYMRNAFDENYYATADELSTFAQERSVGVNLVWSLH